MEHQMKRKYLIGLGVTAGVAGVAALGREQIGAIAGRLSGQDTIVPQKQWDFDNGELRTLMDRTIADQQRIIADAPTPEERERAVAFGRYFEGRRAAIK
jgi:hypothetical protein